jgi:hypothetical protein
MITNATATATATANANANATFASTSAATIVDNSNNTSAQLPNNSSNNNSNNHIINIRDSELQNATRTTTPIHNNTPILPFAIQTHNLPFQQQHHQQQQHQHTSFPAHPLSAPPMMFYDSSYEDPSLLTELESMYFDKFLDTLMMQDFGSAPLHQHHQHQHHPQSSSNTVTPNLQSSNPLVSRFNTLDTSHEGKTFLLFFQLP